MSKKVNFFQIFWSIGGLKVQKWIKKRITLTFSEIVRTCSFFKLKILMKMKINEDK